MYMLKYILRVPEATFWVREAGLAGKHPPLMVLEKRSPEYKHGAFLAKVFLTNNAG